MRFQNPFSALSTTGNDSQVLTVLAATEAPLSVTEIHALIPDGGSRDGVRISLRRLAEQGVVEEVSLGRAFGYRLNREHLLAEAIEEIANAKSRLISRIVSEVESWSTQPVNVVLFGSAARNTMALGSDIDVLVVVPVSKDFEQAEEMSRRVSGLAERITRWTGNDARPLLYTQDEVSAAPIFDSILADGQVVFGDKSWLRRRIRESRRRA